LKSLRNKYKGWPLRGKALGKKRTGLPPTDFATSCMPRAGALKILPKAPF
jgi:hypothetical protein